MLTRIISGSVGIAVAAYIIQQGGDLFAFFCLVLMFIAYREYVLAFQNIGLNLLRFGGFSAIVILWAAAYAFGSDGLCAAALFSTLMALSMAVLRYGKFSINEAVASATGLVYIGLSFPCLMLIRFSGGHSVVPSPFGEMELGCALVWMTFIGTWASDTFAYFAGYFFGRHKLCPNVSPKKTIEGFIGGFIGTIAAVAYLGASFGFFVLPAAGLGFLIAIVAPLGDLVESIIKRHTGIKDSGTLIPGHGGVLDRFDSVIFTAPTVYYFLHFIMGLS